MSTDISIVVGRGIKLPYDDLDDELLDEQGYLDYEEGKVCVISDGMNGEWAYIIKPYKIINEIFEDYHGSFTDELTAEEVRKFEEIYRTIYPELDANFDLSSLKLVIFTWFS